MRRALILTLVLSAGCITRAEYAENVKAQRTYYDATRDDLRAQYDVLPEPSRTTRLRMVDDEAKAIESAEVRAGLRAATAAQGS